MSAPTLALTTAIGDSFNYQLTDPLSDVIQQLVNISGNFQMKYGQSTNGANSTTITATKFYLNTFIVTPASSTHDIDLTQIVDVFGNVLALTKIYRFVAHNNDVSGGSGMIIKPGPSNGWTGPFNGVGASNLLIPAGGDIVLSSPYVGFTVSGSSKILRLQNDVASPTGNSSLTILIAGS